MKLATGVTIWNDAVGKRMSIMYTEVDEATGKIVSDNNRLDRVITDPNVADDMTAVMQAAQGYIESM